MTNGSAARAAADLVHDNAAAQAEWQLTTAEANLDSAETIATAQAQAAVLVQRGLITGGMEAGIPHKG